MSKENPSYYAIIPAQVRYSKNLKPNEKLMYGEITCLSNKKGYCHASNNYFAELYNVSKETISRWISNLNKNNLITIDIIYKEGTKQIISRYIRLCHHPIDEIINTPVDEKVKGITTSNNTTSKIKEKNTKKKFKKPTHNEIKEYLQEKQQTIDIGYFIDYYESKDWMIGKNRMKNWKSAVNNWLRNNKKFEVKNATNNTNRKLTPAEQAEERDQWYRDKYAT